MTKSRIAILAQTLPMIILATACSQQHSDEAIADASPATTAVDASARQAAAPPGIGGIVAPGLAFAYHYAFALPGKSIASVQQDHAAACQRLGPSRCRVTGMRYDQPTSDQISAQLDLLLAPDIAYRFGLDSVASVEKADGRIANASVTGENAGGEIALSQQNSLAIQSEIARIEARFKTGGLKAGEKTELSGKLETLRQQLRGEEQTRRDKEESIATTPVRFTYSSEGILAPGNGFGSALDASWGSMQAFLAAMLLVLGVALPWLAPVALVGLLWRYRKGKRSPHQTAADSHSSAAPADPAAMTS